MNDEKTSPFVQMSSLHVSFTFELSKGHTKRVQMVQSKIALCHSANKKSSWRGGKELYSYPKRVGSNFEVQLKHTKLLYVKNRITTHLVGPRSHRMSDRYLLTSICRASEKFVRGFGFSSFGCTWIIIFAHHCSYRI